MVALIALGGILFALLLICIIHTCWKQNRPLQRRRAVVPGIDILPHKTLTCHGQGKGSSLVGGDNSSKCDKRAMIDDTSSETSDDSCHLPYVAKKVSAQCVLGSWDATTDTSRYSFVFSATTRIKESGKRMQAQHGEQANVSASQGYGAAASENDRRRDAVAEQFNDEHHRSEKSFADRDDSACQISVAARKFHAHRRLAAHSTTSNAQIRCPPPSAELWRRIDCRSETIDVFGRESVNVKSN